jgi:NAD+ diphosphatase
VFHEFAPLRLNNAFHSEVPSEDCTLLCYRGGEVLAAEGDDVVLPCLSMAEHLRDRLTYLFSIGDTAYCLPPADALLDLKGFGWRPVTSLRYHDPQHLAFACAVGHHLYRWYGNHQFCGRCGGKTQPSDTERALICPACGNTSYPTIMPAVIVGIIRGDSLLLTKYAGRPSAYWALVAGFAEIGESMEEAVRRETMEETGLVLQRITYYKSQPWPLTGSLLCGYFAEAAGEEQIRRDEAELQEAVFVPRQEIDVAYQGRALTNEMICQFKRLGREALVREDPLRQHPYRQGG